MIRFRFRKSSRLGANLAACMAFIILAIWGLGLPVSTALGYLVMCLVFLVIIVGLAALAGVALRRFRGENKDQSAP